MVDFQYLDMVLDGEDWGVGRSGGWKVQSLDEIGWADPFDKGRDKVVNV